MTSKSNDATVYTITNLNGVVSRTCDDTSKGGCSSSGKW